MKTHIVLAVLHLDIILVFVILGIMDLVLKEIANVNKQKKRTFHILNLLNIEFSRLLFLVCPNSTFWHSWNQCRPCPDINHIILITPAVNSSFCACKSGFQRREDGRCDIITCPQLEPPENGYFVEQATCNPILHAACGTRCKSGYQLTGSSIRLCLQNGTWSGTNTSCVCKHLFTISICYITEMALRRSSFLIDICVFIFLRNFKFLE